MNKTVKNQWIAALKSGEYKQAKGHLRYRDSFCCLGVLCNLHAQSHPEIAARQTKAGQYMGNSKVLPVEVMDWAGLDSESGGYLRNGKSTSLVIQNDSGLSFPEIAKIIDEEF
jgi:hypothetical protein